MSCPLIVNLRREIAHTFVVANNFEALVKKEERRKKRKSVRQRQRNIDLLSRQAELMKTQKLPSIFPSPDMGKSISFGPI